MRIALLFAALILSPHTVIAQNRIEYSLKFDSSDLAGITVEMRIPRATQSLQLAAHAHPEYDDRYWRYVQDLTARDSQGRDLTVTREDSVLWRIGYAPGEVRVRYRVMFPREEMPRAAWRPFLASTGGLVGGPHSFLYVVGQEKAPATVTLDLPRSWRVATGMTGAATGRTFTAADIHELMESPMLVGRMSEWTFRVKGIPHRVFYWRLPNATPFDTTAFVSGIERLAQKTFDLFGSAPFREYTFMFQDGAYSG